MDLGQRLRQARLEAGLSQRQLCGEEITRNMLSQIENGSARPSMNTMRYLAARLGKPMSFFLEEEAAVSVNQAVMEKARGLFKAEPRQVLAVLEEYQSPDPLFDPEMYLLTALSCIKAAESALDEGRAVYACTLLEKAAQAGKETLYYTQELERKRLLLTYRAKGEGAEHLVSQLPDLLPELMLRGNAALSAGDPEGCIQILRAAAPQGNAQWKLLMADALFAKGDHKAAAEYYQRVEAAFPQHAARQLELCYRQLEDYRMAYFYACKQRKE